MNHINNRPLTTTLTNEIAPDLLTNEIDSRIVKIRPSSTPLDQISRMIGSRHAGSMRVDYYSVDTKDDKSTVTETQRALNLKYGATIDIKVEKAEIFSISETVMIPSIKITSGQYNGQSLVGYITAIDGQTLTILPVNVGTDVDTIPCGPLNEGDIVIRMGRAAKELDVQTAQTVA